MDWLDKVDNTEKEVSNQMRKINANNKTMQKDLKSILYLYLMSKLVFFLFLIYCKYFNGIQYEYGNIYQTYDGVHYFDIAMNGYTHKYQYAFFPLFPLIIRFFSLFNVAIPGTIVLNHIVTLIIAYLFYFTGINILNRTTEESVKISTLWIFSPISICTNILYTESIFMLLTLSAYYFYKKNQYLPAGILLGLSVATRNTGSMLFFAIFIMLLVEVVSKRELTTVINIVVMFVPATLISCIYPMFLYLKLGNWHYFIDVQYEYWERVKSNFLFIVLKDFQMATINPITFIFTNISLIIFIYIIYQAIKEGENKELIMYAIFSLLAIYSTYRLSGTDLPSTSFYRYFYGSFPIYLLAIKRLRIIILTNLVLSIVAILVYCLGGFLI